MVNAKHHIAIIGDPTYRGNGTRIDNNGRPSTDNSGEIAFVGPTWRGIGDGVGTDYIGSEDPDRAPISKTLPAEQGGVQADGKPKSLLQELDEE